jgi:hypothetical protein
MNPVYAPTPYLLKICFNVILPRGFPTKCVVRQRHGSNSRTSHLTTQCHTCQWTSLNNLNVTPSEQPNVKSGIYSLEEAQVVIPLSFDR